VLSLYFTPIVRRAAIRYGVLDVPNTSLKTHKEPVPYLGGVSMWLSFLFALAFTYEGSFSGQVTGILLSASIVVTLGLFDDLKVLSPKVKLGGQVVAVFVLIKSGIMVQLAILPPWANLLLTVFWMVGVTNAVNLIDVSDGLAAGVSSIAGMFLYIIALAADATVIPMLVLAQVGASLGFLAYNRPPARIYMGDTGSMLLGFLLGTVAMIGQYTFNHRFAAVAPVVILGIPIFDTLYVMGVRKVRGIPMMQGSPDHFAVRMRNNGWPSGRIALVTYLAAGALGLAGLGICFFSFDVAVGITAGVGGLAGLTVLALWRLGRGPGAVPAGGPAPTPADSDSRPVRFQ
jgi:UDP-GlcNAc:undecaprenyl-phosphate GlcNAc-1-phosphate transferase